MSLNDNKDNKFGSVVIYESQDGNTSIDVKFDDDTVWLTQQQMAQLFATSRTNIIEHINNIYQEGELDKSSTCRDFRQVHIEGSREVERKQPFYNLDMIISLGYRVKSKIATHFRKWATKHLNEYLLKGFTLNDERLKNGDGDYWKELFDRIKDIRSSEKIMYRQVLDLYATSIDYDPKSSESIAFFKMVQNKLHYAVNGKTAAELIYQRADGNEPFMGLRSFKGDFPLKKDVVIAKNYLDETELKILNNLVSGFFDFAETQALRHRAMTMSDYAEQLDSLLSASGNNLLENAGKISHKMAVDKALDEYKKYQQNALTPVEESYLQTIKALEQKVKERPKSKKESKDES